MDPGDGECTQPGRRQLDRDGQPVELDRDLADGGPLPFCGRKSGLDLAGALDKQRDGFVGPWSVWATFRTPILLQSVEISA